ncbi:lipase family protein [Streptomyces sp. NPDC020875]|uniref:lipase family protein n=1 Tax=Streptomyces sp. NPDC020875 TaxID=3154898 RepID=UPI0033F5549D
MSVPSALDHQVTGYSLAHAYWMARAARLAYENPAEVERQARDWGFDRVRHHESLFEPPFALEDTQAYTMASDRMIVTAFRGTEPALIRDWLSDAATPPWPGPARTGYMHYGFAEALDSVYPGVRETVAGFRDGGQTVWFTGHSLGGALAMLAGCRMYLEEPRLRADGVYTYGQPRACDRVLAAAVNKGFKDRLFRFVNNDDVVPLLPPEPAYAHTDALRWFDAKGTLHTSMPRLAGAADRLRGAVADPVALPSGGVRDHFIDAYVTVLERSLQ